MGKAKGGNNAKGKQEPIKKCICDDPYKCSCGNRPERPSKGHKWYPLEQVWGGKGHKQKGASGQVSSISKEATITEKGKTKIEMWQRLPHQLLEEYCSKNNRGKPKYMNMMKKNMDGDGSSTTMYKYRVVVPDSNNAGNNNNNNKNDLFFVSAQAVSNEEQALEEGCLLALLHLTPTLPHERKLPEPYKTTWLNAVESSKKKKPATATATAEIEATQNSSTITGSNVNNKTALVTTTEPTTTDCTSKVVDLKNGVKNSDEVTSVQRAVASTSLQLATSYTSIGSQQKQIAEQRKIRNQRIRKQEAIQMANQHPQVYMSAQIRKQIENLLRNNMNINNSSNNSNEPNPAEEDDEYDIDEENWFDDDIIDIDGKRNSTNNDTKRYIIQRLYHEGFTKQQSQRAYQEYSNQERKRNDINSTDEYHTNSNDLQLENIYEECLQWLLVHLDEDQLPEGFDPRGRTLDVIVPPTINSLQQQQQQQQQQSQPLQSTHSSVDNNNNNKSNDDDIVSDEINLFASKYGISSSIAKVIFDKSKCKSTSTVEILWNTFVQASAATVDETLSSKPTVDNNNEFADPADVVYTSNITSSMTMSSTARDEMYIQEMEALDAIYGTECTVVRSSTTSSKTCTEDDDRNPTTTTTTTVVVLNIPNNNNDSSSLLLEIVLQKHIYPIPCRVLVTGKWPDKSIGGYVHVELIKYVLETVRQQDYEPMIFNLYTRVSDIFAELFENEDWNRINVTQQQQIENANRSIVSVLGLEEPLLNKNTSDNNDTIKTLPRLPTNATPPNTLVQPTIDPTSRHEQPNIQNQQQQQQKQTSSSSHKKNHHTKTFWNTLPKDTKPALPASKASISIQNIRKSLPAASARQDFLNAMKEAEQVGGSRVLLVTGETGSGKSTQLPAFLLENDPIGSKIVVTQPRRIAATGVATRVAEERGENKPGSVGSSIGYVVRGDSALCVDSTRLVFCTTGVLLRQFQNTNKNALQCITHIVVDEVHERSLDSDILLGLLKQYLPSNPGLRVVLMSATLDTNRFRNYFDGITPHIHIPGRTFPVMDYTLEDVLALTGYIPPKKKKPSNLNNNNNNNNNNNSNSKKDTTSSGGKATTNQQQRLQQFNNTQVTSTDSNYVTNKEQGKNEEDSAVTEQTSNSSTPNESSTSSSLELIKRIDETIINYDLLACLVKTIINNRKDDDDTGSILIFLPGIYEINQAMDSIKYYTKGMPLLLLPLHGSLQPHEQRKVFPKAQQGFTKIILSTNVAETSVTIPDCTVVIDTAREKQSSYDPINRMPLLVDTFASKASLQQRRGRAGRVQAGSCYKLLSLATLSSSSNKLRNHTPPEIHRVALDQPLLQLLSVGVENGTGNFLQTLLDPPSMEAVHAATNSLLALGAVSKIPHKDNNMMQQQQQQVMLTPLGMHLSSIPAPPVVGKLLVMGCILGCRESALAMAAGMSLGRNPLLRIDTISSSFRPKQRSDDVDAKRGGDDANEVQQQQQQHDAEIEMMKQTQIIEERNKYFKIVGNSDHALVALLYTKWKSCAVGGANTYTSQKRFCETIGLNNTIMNDIDQLVQQLDSALTNAGFPSSSESNRNNSTTITNSAGAVATTTTTTTTTIANTTSWKIVHACIVAAMAPSQLIKIQRPATKYTETIEGAKEKGHVARELQFYIRIPSTVATATTTNNNNDSNDTADNNNNNNNNSSSTTTSNNNNKERVFVGNSKNEQRVFIHPSSINFTNGTYHCPYLVYNTIITTSKAFVRDVTECNIYSLLLFGGPMDVQASKGYIVIDSWVYIIANARIGSLIGGIRKQIDILLEQKINNPSIELANTTLMRLVVKLIRTGGL